MVLGSLGHLIKCVRASLGHQQVQEAQDGQAMAPNEAVNNVVVTPTNMGPPPMVPPNLAVESSCEGEAGAVAASPKCKQQRLRKSVWPSAAQKTVKGGAAGRCMPTLNAYGFQCPACQLKYTLRNNYRRHWHIKNRQGDPAHREEEPPVPLILEP